MRSTQTHTHTHIGVFFSTVCVVFKFRAALKKHLANSLFFRLRQSPPCVWRSPATQVCQWFVFLSDDAFRCHIPSACVGTKGDDALCRAKGATAAHCSSSLSHLCSAFTEVDTVCDPLRLRPLVCTMPSRGCRLLLQVGDVRGQGGAKEGREWGGGGGGGRAKAMWGQVKRSPEYSDIPISCPVSSGLKERF